MAVRLYRKQVLPTQGAFLECEENIHGLVGGLGAGKTNIAATKFMDRLLMYPEAQHAVANKDLPQYKRGTAISIIDELRSRELKYSYNRTDGSIRIRNSPASIIPLSAENYEGWRAFEADTIWADELTTWGPSAKIAFTEFLVPRSRYSPNGVRYYHAGFPLKPMLFFTTNPPTDTVNWVYDLLVRKHFCTYWHMSTRDNFLMLDHEGYVRKLERLYSPDLWPIYIDGKFGNATEGSVYKGFDHVIHDSTQRKEPIPAELPPFKLDPDQPLVWALDFNVGLMCSVIGQFRRQRNIVNREIPELFRPVMRLEERRRKAVDGYQEVMCYIFDHIRIPDAGSPDVVDEFIKRYGEHARRKGVRIYGDASGGARSQTMSAQSAARSNWAIILQRLHLAGIPFDFRVPTTNPSVMDRINAVKARLRNIDGVGIIVDGDKAPFMVEDLIVVKYKPGTNDIDKENPLITHLSDALGYMLWLEQVLAEGTTEVTFLSERAV